MIVDTEMDRIHLAYEDADKAAFDATIKQQLNDVEKAYFFSMLAEHYAELADSNCDETDPVILEEVVG